MNIFFCVGDELWTPALGSILPGVTRRTVIELLSARGEKVLEKRMHGSELVDYLERGELNHMFTTSTALGVNRVTNLCHSGRNYKMSERLPNNILAAIEEHKMMTRGFPAGLSNNENIRERSYEGAL